MNCEWPWRRGWLAWATTNQVIERVLAFEPACLDGLGDSDARRVHDPTGPHGLDEGVTARKRCRGFSGVEELEHQDQTDVIVNWFVETCDEVTPSNFIAEVAVEKAAVELCLELTGVVTLLEEENMEIAQGAPTARAT